MTLIQACCLGSKPKNHPGSCTEFDALRFGSKTCEEIKDGDKWFSDMFDFKVNNLKTKKLH